jgi:purine-binding chemotaxis protein CheW
MSGKATARKAPLTVSDDEESATQSADTRQFVIFHVKDEMFAVPLAEVQEIIRMPAVVRMPLSPPSLEGLANLRGTMLPILDLRRVFGFEPLTHDDTTRVVVLDQGRPVGLVVDRMANVVTADARSIEPTGPLQATVDTDLLAGMIKGRDGASMVMILDAAKLIKREFRDIEGRAGAAALAGNDQLPGAGEGASARRETIDEVQLVSFEVAGQEYAFPIEEVQEIVQLPDKITALPNSASHVLGVITLRNRLLPLVSLRDMFRLPPAAVNDANKVVVVSPGGSGSVSVGVAMDCIKEVLRVNRASIDPMPAMLAQNRTLDDIRSICRLEDGRRLVSILSAGHMFSPADLRKMAEETQQEGDAMTDAQEGARAADADDEEQFVVFRLQNEEYGVPIASVQEIVRVPEALTKVPKTPPFIEGVINLRGSVLPVVDQRRRFGLAASDRSDRQRIMVFTIHDIRTGFIVDSVSEVMRISARFIGAAPKLSAEQQKLIRRVANLEAQKRMILLLDVNQLLDVKELGALKPSGD